MTQFDDKHIQNYIQTRFNEGLKVSIALLQRKFKINYEYALKIIQELK